VGSNPNPSSQGWHTWALRGLGGMRATIHKDQEKEVPWAVQTPRSGYMWPMGICGTQDICGPYLPPLTPTGAI
jgi:hypothetical protein